MKTRFSIVFVLIVSMVVSCTSMNKEEGRVHPNTAQSSEHFSYSKEELKFMWTAYKYTVKAPVTGTFNEVYIDGYQKAGSIMGLFEDCSIKIPVATINSKNEERDPKLVHSFFGNLIETDTIYAKAIEVKGNNENGTIVFSLALNGKENNVGFRYYNEGAQLKLNGSIDILNWDGQAALDGLNQVCGELHTGKDGVTKFWPFFDIDIKVPITKTIND